MLVPLSSVYPWDAPPSPPPLAKLVKSTVKPGSPTAKLGNTAKVPCMAKPDKPMAKPDKPTGKPVKPMVNRAKFTGKRDSRTILRMIPPMILQPIQQRNSR